MKTILTNLYGAWLRSRAVLLTGYEDTDPASVRMHVDDAQANGDIAASEVVEVLPLAVHFFGDGQPAYLLPTPVETGWSHAQAISVGGAVEPACPACWPRACNCDVAPGAPPCPKCGTADDVYDEQSVDGRRDYECLACGTDFDAPRPPRKSVAENGFEVAAAGEVGGNTSGEPAARKV